MSAPPAPEVQPVSLMNQLSAIASMNAASAVSAYSGPGDRLPAPMPPPVMAIQVLPKTGPYHRNPMTIAATVAMMIATQFMFPPPTRVVAHRLEQGHKHSDLARVRLKGRAETLTKQTLFGLRPKIERRKGHQESSGDKHEVPRREAGTREMQTESRIDGVAHETVRPVAHELVVAVDLELDVIVPSERRDRPDCEADAEHDHRETDPAN